MSGSSSTDCPGIYDDGNRNQNKLYEYEDSLHEEFLSVREIPSISKTTFGNHLRIRPPRSTDVPGVLTNAFAVVGLL